MPCCTLIALLISQPALFYGATKARLFAGAAGPQLAHLRDWRIVGLVGLALAEILVLASGAFAFLAAGPYPNLLRSAIHICGFGR